jgi:formate dehydrogenase major subunit
MRRRPMVPAPLSAFCGSPTTSVGRILEKLAGSADEMDRPILDLTWDYPVAGQTGEPDAESVLAAINGSGADGEPLGGPPS